MAEENSKQFEVICGVTIAIFAAVLAVTDLFGGKYGDDEIKTVNEKSAAYMWYQSKSIKETVVEGQHDLLKALRSAGAIAPAQVTAIDEHIKTLEEQVKRYGKEKKEILLGSAKVGKENWAQDVGGEMGKVIGAQEYEAQAEKLGTLGDRLDLATLFLQLCLVLGAISLVLANRKTQRLFYALMCVLGLIGSGISAFALITSGL